MNTPLDQWKSAVERGDVASVRALFEQYGELAEMVNAQVFAFDSSAIFASRDNLEMVDLLLKHGADINAKTGWEAGGFGILEGIDPHLAKPLIERGALVDIWAAVSLDDMARARELIEQDPDLVIAAGGDGVHPLHYARSVPMVEFLIEKGANINARCLDHGSTALQYLVQDQSVVRCLLKHGAEPDVFMAAYWGDASLLEASIAADASCCDALMGTGEWTHLGKGDIYNWKIGHDVTPAQVARSRGHNDIAVQILQLSSPAAQLRDAIWGSHEAVVSSLINEHPNAVSDLIKCDSTAMCRAAWENNVGAVEILLQLGFDPHKTGVHDSTPLDRAAFHGYTGVVELLLERDPNPPLLQKNEFGGTPLGACLFGLNNGWDTGHKRDHVGSVRLLIKAGSEVTNWMIGAGNAETDLLIKEHLSKD